MTAKALWWLAPVAALTVAYGCVLFGARAAARRDSRTHRRAMQTAAVLVGLWLVAYVVKQAVFGVEHFEGSDVAARWLYRPILTLHMALAVATVALGGANLYLGLVCIKGGGAGAESAHLARHRRLGRALLWTFTGTMVTAYAVYALLFLWPWGVGVGLGAAAGLLGLGGWAGRRLYGARRAAESAGRLAEQRFHHLFESGSTGLLLVDARGRILLANRLIEAWFGYRRDELIGRAVDTLLLERDRPAHVAQREAYMAWPEARLMGRGREVLARRKDGGAFPVEVGLAPFDDESGRQVLCTVIDITQRRLMEEALRDSEERYALVVQGTNQGVWDWDVRAGAMYFSPRLKEALGYGEDDLSEGFESLAGLLAEEERAAVVARFQEAVTPPGRAGALDLECRLRAKTGGARWFRLRGQVLWDVDGRAIRMAGSANDETERRLMIDDLKASGERFRLLSESLPVGVIEIDEGGQCVYRNRAWESILGASSLDRLACHWLDWFGEDEREVLTQEWIRLRHEWRPIQRDVCLPMRDAEPRWGQLILVTMSGDSGMRFIGTLEDITARKQAEAERARYERQLAQGQRLEALGTLAGGIAHDFNNLLWVILGNSERALRKLPPDSPLRPLQSDVLAAGRRAKDLVAQILAFSRRREGPVQAVALDEVVRETVTLLRSTLPASIAMDVQVALSCGTVLGDASQLHQVVMNLCTNAFHAMGEVGRLGVRLTPILVGSDTAPRPPDLSPGAYLLLEISDTGCGMDAETQARMFEPFFTTKGVGKGTGLGLSMVHGIVTGMQGGIHVESAVGCGTTVRIFLPRGEQAVAMEEPARGEGLTGPRASILLVDDEPAVLAAVTGMLEDVGHRVTPCARGEDALARLRETPSAYDLVLTDQTMPGLSGLDVADAVRRIQPALPIILVTGFSRTVTEDAAAAHGVTRLLRKPVEWADLARAVQDVLGAEQGV